MSLQQRRSRSAHQRTVLIGDDVTNAPTSFRSYSSIPSAVGTTDTSTPSSPAALSHAATNDSGLEDNSFTFKQGHGTTDRIFQEHRHLFPSFLSDSGRLGVIRDEFRRSNSVPSKITQLFTKSPLAPVSTNDLSPSNGVDMSVSGKSSLSDFEFSGITTCCHDDGDGDGHECVEDSCSRRPVADERRVLVEDDVPIHPSGPELDWYLDDLIFDPHKNKVEQQPSPGSVREQETMRQSQDLTTNVGRLRSVSVENAPSSCSDSFRVNGTANSAIGTFGFRSRPMRGNNDGGKHGRSLSLGPTCTYRDGRASLEQASSNAAVKGPSSPIKWQRRLTKQPFTWKRDELESMDSLFCSRGQYEADSHYNLNGSTGASSTENLSTFIQQKSMSPRLTADARTVCLESSDQYREPILMGSELEKVGQPTTTTTFHHDGNQQATDIESLPVFHNTESSPNSKKEAVNVPPSEHCENLGSERISMGNSVSAGVSPPYFVTKGRSASFDTSRGLFPSATKVVGDQVSAYFQERSTPDLMEMVDEMQKSREHPKLGTSLSSQLNDDSVHSHGVDQLLDNEGSLQEILPSLSRPKSRSMSLSAYRVREDRPSRDSSRSEMQHRRCRSTSHPNRLRRIQNTQSLTNLSSVGADLTDFEVRNDSPYRPTNRRSLMGNIHQVSALKDSTPGPTKEVTNSGIKSKKSEKSNSKKHSGKRSTEPKKCRDDEKKIIRKAKKKSSSSGKKKANSAGEGNEVEEELQKSFIDMYLDHEVETHDSASPHYETADYSEQNKRSVEVYKESLACWPIEDSNSKLRIEPYCLESSQRMLLPDPINRRETMKKMKSVPTLDNPSQRLLELFPPDEDKINHDEDQPKGAGICDSPVKAPQSPKKKTTTPRTTKAKKGSIKRKSTGKKDPSANKAGAESKDMKSSSEKLHRSLSKCLPGKLPLTEIEADGQPLLKSRLLKKSNSLSNLEVGDGDDKGSIILLVERLMRLANATSISQDGDIENFSKSSTKEENNEQLRSVLSKASSLKMRVGGKSEKKSRKAKGNETTTLDVSQRECKLPGSINTKTSIDVVTNEPMDVPSVDDEEHINPGTSIAVMRTMVQSANTEEAHRTSPIVGKRTKPRKTSSTRDESTLAEARKAIPKLPATPVTTGQIAPRVMRLGVMDDHKTERPRSLRSIRRAPPVRVRSSSRKDFAENDGNASAHSLKLVATDDDDDDEECGLASPLSSKSKLISRKHEAKPKRPPSLTSLEAKLRSSNIIRIVEGSILELQDDSTICSELTTDIAFLSSPVREKLNSSRSDLSAITEGGATSSADLSASDSISKDLESHLNRRWQSQPSVGNQPSGVHVDDTYDDDKLIPELPQSPRKSFNWFKKTNPFNKK
jgi:hypothetical protein